MFRSLKRVKFKNLGSVVSKIRATKKISRFVKKHFNNHYFLLKKTKGGNNFLLPVKGLYVCKTYNVKSMDDINILLALGLMYPSTLNRRVLRTLRRIASRYL